MKHLKMLGLLVMAAASLMAFAGNAYASNPVLTSPSGTEYTGHLEATATGTLTLKAGFATITCTTSIVTGSVTTNTFGVASGAISTLDFGNCGSATVDTIKTGSLEVLTGGEVKAKNNEVTVSVLGTSCGYGGAATGTKLGTLKGGTTATLSISASLPKTSGGALCANPAAWTGSYSVTSPDTLLVD